MNPLSKEIVVLIQNYDIWTYLSKSDIKNRFRRSKLGILWPIVQQLAFSLGAGFIWASVFGLNPGDFIPFLTLGFALWGFISASMTEGCNSLSIAHGYLKQLPMSQSIFIFRTLLTQVLYLAIGFITAILISILFGTFSPVGLLISIPGLFILLLFAYGAIGSFAYLGMRYRDIQHGLVGLLSMLFVVTPIIYPAEVLIQKGLSFAIYLNPFSSLIEVVRFPILNGELASGIHYSVALLFAFILVAFRFFIGKRWGHLVVFWS